MEKVPLKEENLIADKNVLRNLGQPQKSNNSTKDCSLILLRIALYESVTSFLDRPSNCYL